jgi:hypothetical protein
METSLVGIGDDGQEIGDFEQFGPPHRPRGALGVASALAKSWDGFKAIAPVATCT